MTQSFTRRTLCFAALSAVILTTPAQAKNDKSGGNGGNNGNGGGSNNGKGKGATKTEKAMSRGVTVNIEFVHRSGIREIIVNGQYEIFDAQGRRIIRRRASSADIARLRLLAR